MTEKKEELIQRALCALYPRFSAIYILNLSDETYEELRADEEFKQIITDSGTFDDLYRNLFQRNKEGKASSENNYDIFMNKDLFHRDNYRGRMTLVIGTLPKRYDYHILKMSDTQSTLLVMEDDGFYERDAKEKLKMDTIQENYLFSMVVDLKNDLCNSSSTTEIQDNNQEHLEIKYSQWRNMIVNMFLPEDRNMFLTISDPDYVIKKLENEKLFKFEIKMQNMQGEYIWVRLTFSRMQGFRKEVPIFVFTVQDINADMLRLLRQANIIAAIEEKNAALTNINKAQSVFISNMSHEIRTPVNAILGMNEIILRETQDENILSYAYDIKNAGKMLLSIINDILDYSRIESGMMEIIPVEYNIGVLIRDIKNLITIRIKEKNLKFNLDIDENLPSILLGDEVRIKQVIVNLLTNAVKYTEKGSVTFSVDYVSASDSELGLRVSVTDTGIGIKKEDMEKLFTAFTRLDGERNRNIEGTGLGISIVVRLLEQMGSHLEVKSEYGKGSTFSFILPQKIINRAPIGNIATIPKKTTSTEASKSALFAPKAKILVVDDTSTNLKVVIHLLKNSGIKIDTASNGEECLNLLSRNDYDLILLDHLMPLMDGIETVERIRRMGGKYDSLPVIALTANVISGSRERYLMAGFTDYLEKPITGTHLEDMIRNHLPEELLENP